MGDSQDDIGELEPGCLNRERVVPDVGRDAVPGVIEGMRDDFKVSGPKDALPMRWRASIGSLSAPCAYVHHYRQLLYGTVPRIDVLRKGHYQVAGRWRCRKRKIPSESVLATRCMCSTTRLCTSHCLSAGLI